MTFKAFARRALIAATAMTAFAGNANAQQVDRIIAFGDSYADTGNAIAILDATASPPVVQLLHTIYPTGRFSGGTNYIDTLSNLLGVPVYDYAVGGATTGPTNNGFPGLPGYTQEVGLFLSNSSGPLGNFPTAGGFQAHDLLALSIGGNDARAFYNNNPSATTAEAAAAAQASVANATANTNALVAAGAPTISFLALDAGGAPDLIGYPTDQALAHAYSTAFNAGFSNTLAGYAANGTMVHYLDGSLILQNVMANPSAYGISNIYCPSYFTSTTCILNSRGYLFYADGVHLTSDGFAIVGRYVDRQLAAPLTLQAPADVGVDTAREFGRVLDSRLPFGAPTASGIVPGLRFYLVGDGLNATHNTTYGNSNFETKAYGATLGADLGFEAGGAGIAVNLSRPEADFGNDAAKVRTHTGQIGAYAGVSFGGAFVKGNIGYGWDTHHITRMGVVDDMRATPKGHHFLAGAKAGYMMPMMGMGIGPVVSIDYARATVDGYTEAGDPALTLNVSSQKAKSLRGDIGLEAHGDFGAALNLKPYVSAMLEKELSSNGRSIVFSQTASPNIINTFGFAPTSKRVYGRFSAGGTAQVANMLTFDAGVSITAGKKHGNETSGQVGVSVAF